MSYRQRSNILLSVEQNDVVSAAHPAIVCRSRRGVGGLTAHVGRFYAGRGGSN